MNLVMRLLFLCNCCAKLDFSPENKKGWQPVWFFSNSLISLRIFQHSKRKVVRKKKKIPETFHKYKQTLQNGKVDCADVRQDIHGVILQHNGCLTPASWNQMISSRNAEAASCHVIQNASI